MTESQRILHRLARLFGRNMKELAGAAGISFDTLKASYHKPPSDHTFEAVVEAANQELIRAFAKNTFTKEDLANSPLAPLFATERGHTRINEDIFRRVWRGESSLADEGKLKEQKQKQTSDRPSESDETQDDINTGVLDTTSRAGDNASRPWNVPFPKNPHFTGREDILERLHESLAGRKPTALTQIQAIHGLGGIGKTQTAVEYAYRHREEYSGVFWLRSDREAEIIASFFEIADLLELRQEGKPSSTQVLREIRRWLRGCPGWLMVFDNADTPALIEKYLLDTQSGSVMITSRYCAWGKLAQPLNLDLWTEEEAVSYLVRRIGKHDPADCKRLAETLGHLPLALEQAVVYLEETGLAILEYCQLFERYNVKVFDQSLEFSQGNPTVATVWRISMERIENESSDAVALLGLCSFLPPDHITEGLLRRGTAMAPGSLAFLQDELAYTNAVAVLRKNSMIEGTPKAFSVHRLVQAAVRDRLNSSGHYQFYSEIALQLLHESGIEPLEGEDAARTTETSVKSVPSIAAGLLLPAKRSTLAWVPAAICVVFVILWVSALFRGASLNTPFDMVKIQAGTYLMGSPEFEEGRYDQEGPQTKVTLSYDFWIGKYEVTQHDFHWLMGYDPSQFNGDKTDQGFTDYGHDRSRPVERVRWEEAVEFCHLLTVQERQKDRLPEGFEYRLPTEAEWEYACRAGSSGRFSFGDDDDRLGEHAWFNVNADHRTHRVGTKKPNAWGLYDMHGNIWELCQGWFSVSLSGGHRTNPKDASSGRGRVIRGGGWNGQARHARSASRDWIDPSERYDFVGFRVVLGPSIKSLTPSELSAASQTETSR